MTVEEKITYLRYRLRRAHETLIEAKTLHEQDLLAGAVNRIYYAMFYSVSALALSHGFSTSSHAQLRGYFNREFIKDGIISIELGKLYGNAFDARTKGDYDDLVVFEPEQVGSMLEQAEIFVETLINLVEKSL